MGRKAKKKTQVYRKKERRSIATGGGKTLEFVSCVMCPKESVLVEVGYCGECEHHDNNTCSYTSSKGIEVIGFGTPHKFNRGMSDSIANNERDIALNYYIPTKIVQPVQRIPRVDYPNYTGVNELLISGGFKEKDEPCKSEEITITKPELILNKSLSGDGCDFMLDGEKYTIVAGATDTTERAVKVVYYLYNLFTLGGLADIKINDKSYKVSMSRVDRVDVDMVLGTVDDCIIIGEI